MINLALIILNSNNNTVNNYNVENLNVVNADFSQLKQLLNYKEILCDAFERNLRGDNDKLVLTRKKDYSLKQIDVLKDNSNLIDIFIKFGLNNEYLVLIQNALFLTKLGHKKIKLEKIKLNRVENRILNLCTSGWIVSFVQDFQINFDGDKDINKEFLNLISDNSIIFVNQHFTECELSDKLEICLFTKNQCYLHTIGKKILICVIK